jgi:hypothetical protein
MIFSILSAFVGRALRCSLFAWINGNSDRPEDATVTVRVGNRWYWFGVVFAFSLHRSPDVASHFIVRIGVDLKFSISIFSILLLRIGVFDFRPW